MPVIGFLSSASPDLYVIRLRAFQQGLKEAGYVEGQNVAIEYRWAEGQNNRLPALAAELAHRHVTVLVAGGGTPTAVAAKAATTTVPIVFAVAVDPVKAGLVASLILPGGNLTGVTNLGVEVGQSGWRYCTNCSPQRPLSLCSSTRANPLLLSRSCGPCSRSARALGVQLHVLNASTERDLDTVFATLGQQRAGALLIMPDVFFNTRAEQLAALSLRYAVPTIYEYRPFARPAA